MNGRISLWQREMDRQARSRALACTKPFANAIKHRPRMRLTIRQRTRVLQQGAEQYPTLAAEPGALSKNRHLWFAASGGGRKNW
jgi:hypothetical protein